jgi:NTE family protein
MKTALVISGGGSKGAFAAGAVKYLYETYCRDGWFDIVGGTSTGSLITPLAGLFKEPALAGEALSDLERLYTTITTRDILDKRSIFTLLFKPDALNGSAPLELLIETYLTAQRFEYLRDPRAPETYVVYTNFRTGREVFVSPREPGVDLAGFRRALLASCSVPVYMESTRIGGDACYDGGVSEILPLRRAVFLGAERLLSIRLDPPVPADDTGPLSRIDQVLLRTFAIMLNAGLTSDIERTRLINDAVLAKDDLRGLFADDPVVLEKIDRALERHPDLFGSHRRLVDLDMDIYPDRPLTGDALIFEPAVMKRWFREGYDKARAVVTRSPFRDD